MKKTVSNLIWGLFLFAVLMMAGVCSVSAYIDPSVVSFAATAIGGIVIAAGAVIFVWWRNVKKKVADKLGIDEDANKEKEEDLVITTDEISAETPVETAETAETAEPAAKE